jgi:hypothetical protein
VVYTSKPIGNPYVGINKSWQGIILILSQHFLPVSGYLYICISLMTLNLHGYMRQLNRADPLIVFTSRQVSKQ